MSRAAIIKCHRLGVFNNRNWLSYISRDQDPESKLLAGLVSPKASLLGSQTAVFSLRPHMVFPWCVCEQISSYKHTSRIGLGPTLVTSDQLSQLFKDPDSKGSHILRYWEQTSAYEIWKTQLSL